MKTISAVVVCVVLFIACGRALAEPPATYSTDADANSMHISISDLFTCDGSGHIRFTDPGSVPNFFNPRKIQIRTVSGQLSDLQLRVVRGAAEDFIRDPAPFYSDSRLTDLVPEIIKVRVGDRARMSYLYGVPAPPQLLRFYNVLALALTDAHVDGDPAIRDAAVRWMADARYLHAYPRAEFVIPNDDPVALFNQILADPSMEGKKTNLLCLLTGLEGTAFGDKFLEFLQSHPKDVGSEPLLRAALLGGSTKAIDRYRAVLDERFWDVPDDSLRQAFDDAGIKALAAAIGEDTISRKNALKAWEWLAKHQERLQFDRNAHKFQLVGGQ